LQERPEHVAAMDLVERGLAQTPCAAQARGLRPRALRRWPAAARGAGRWRWRGRLLGAACAGLAAVAAWTMTVHEQRWPRRLIAWPALPWPMAAGCG
jgi:transmembrane sensor